MGKSESKRPICNAPSEIRIRCATLTKYNLLYKDCGINRLRWAGPWKRLDLRGTLSPALAGSWLFLNDAIVGGGGVVGRVVGMGGLQQGMPAVYFGRIRYNLTGVLTISIDGPLKSDGEFRAKATFEISARRSGGFLGVA